MSADGKSVSGHLGRWGVPHTGFLNKRVMIPRSATNYASYCKRRRYTDKGEVFTGPIILLGGHKATADVINERLADPQYAWADVIVTDGLVGPWVCGTVRPARRMRRSRSALARQSPATGSTASSTRSRSVNAEGFDVARPTAYTIEAYDEGEDHYLAASFALSTEEAESTETDDYDAVLAAARRPEDDDAGSEEGSPQVTVLA